MAIVPSNSPLRDVGVICIFSDPPVARFTTSVAIKTPAASVLTTSTPGPRGVAYKRPAIGAPLIAPEKGPKPFWFSDARKFETEFLGSIIKRSNAISVLVFDPDPL